MSEFKGTPNEWKVRNVRNENVQYVNGGVNHTIFKIDIQADLTNKHIVEIRGAKQFEKELLANANLIAAAPELLEALQLLLYGWENADMQHDVTASFDNAKSAINKALGN